MTNFTAGKCKLDETISNQIQWQKKNACGVGSVHISHGHLKIDVPNLVTCLNQTPKFERYVVRCGFKNGHQKCMCLIKDWTMHSNHDNHSRFN